MYYRNISMMNLDYDIKFTDFFALISFIFMFVVFALKLYIVYAIKLSLFFSYYAFF